MAMRSAKPTAPDEASAKVAAALLPVAPSPRQCTVKLAAPAVSGNCAVGTTTVPVGGTARVMLNRLAKVKTNPPEALMVPPAPALRLMSCPGAEFSVTAPAVLTSTKTVVPSPTASGGALAPAPVGAVTSSGC